MWKLSLKASAQKKTMQNFFLKNCAICFLLFKAFQRDIKSPNQKTGSRSKYTFSWVKLK